MLAQICVVEKGLNAGILDPGLLDSGLFRQRGRPKAVFGEGALSIG